MICVESASEHLKPTYRLFPSDQINRELKEQSEQRRQFWLRLVHDITQCNRRGYKPETVLTERFMFICAGKYYV